MYVCECSPEGHKEPCLACFPNGQHVLGIHTWEAAAEAMCQRLTSEEIDLLLATGMYEDAVAAFWDTHGEEA